MTSFDFDFKKETYLKRINKHKNKPHSLNLIPAGAEDDVEFMTFRREYKKTMEISIRENKEKLEQEAKPFKAPYPAFPKY
jgi:GrpB-like predicted nucleotidyltransferase (UPF0157 family)